MLTAAFAGAIGSWATGSPDPRARLSVLAAALAVALVQAWLSVTLRANQLVIGIGINILALGGTDVLYREIFGPLSREISRACPVAVAAPRRPPGARPGILPTDLARLRRAGDRRRHLVALEHTALGLAVRAVGEEPRAADKSGLPVTRVRYGGVLFTGAMSGLAGCSSRSATSTPSPRA